MHRLDGLIGAKRRERELATAAGPLVAEFDSSYAALMREWEEALTAALDLALSQRSWPPQPYATAARSDALRRLELDCALQSEAFDRHLLQLEERINDYHARPDQAAKLADLRGALQAEAAGAAGMAGTVGTASSASAAGTVGTASYAGSAGTMGAAGSAGAAGSMGAASSAGAAGMARPAGAAKAAGGRNGGSGGSGGEDGTEPSDVLDYALRQTQSVPIGGHTLPPLPYAYNALEPYIDERTMRIHHDKHHQSYVDGLNAAERKLQEARNGGNFDLVKHWERELAFNGAGHYLHTLFWDTMSPQGGGQPSGELLSEINRSFGGYDKFKRQFSEAANKVEGGGWAVLVWSPRSRRLEILTAEKHQNLSQWDAVPLLPLDVWEHAYYLKHQNERAAYVKDWWSVVNWPYVAERFAQASALQWVPY